MTAAAPRRDEGRLTWVPVAALLAAGAALACWGVPARPEDALARARREGVLRIGHAIEAPYVFLDERGGLTGAEVELARAVVARLGIPRVEWLQAEFAALLPELEAGRFDAVVAGMFVTPEREARVAFSAPSFRVTQALLVRAGNPHGLHAYAELAGRPELKAAVLHGSVEERLLRQAGVPPERIVVVPDALTGAVAVETSLADALALSAPSLRFLAARRPQGGTELAAPFLPPAGAGRGSAGAVAFRKGDLPLRDAWSRELAGILGSPAHRRERARFGFGDDELPEGTPAAGASASGREP